MRAVNFTVMRMRLVLVLSSVVVLAACGRSGNSESETSTSRVKNAALIQPSTSLVAGQNMTKPTLVLASTTTLQTTTLSTTPGITITPRPTTTLVAGQDMTAPTLVLASTTTLQSAGVLGARWQGQTFTASYANTSSFATCPGVLAPTGIAAAATPAHVQWSATLAPPANDNTIDLVLVEVSNDNKTWTIAGYTRLKANAAQLTNVKSGQKLFVRAAYYRTTSTPCITPRSAAVEIIVR